MKNITTLLKDYPTLIKKMIKAKSDKISESSNFSEEIVKLLKIDNIKMWSRLWNIFYLLEDTEEAKENFMKYNLSGPTKFNDIGEKYLRLYGLLNSIWLQMNAIVELYAIFKCNGKSDLYKKLKSLDIISLRNIAGSHTINYIDEKTDKTLSYVIARITLDDDEILCVDENNNSITIDLMNSINVFNKTIIDIYEIISNKILSTIFKNDPKKIKNEFQNELNILKEISKGNIVYRIDKDVIIISPAKRKV